MDTHAAVGTPDGSIPVAVDTLDGRIVVAVGTLDGKAVSGVVTWEGTAFGQLLGCPAREISDLGSAGLRPAVPGPGT